MPPRELPPEKRRVRQYASMFTQSESDRIEAVIADGAFPSGSEMVRTGVLRLVEEYEGKKAKLPVKL
jgi:Arc/MetJ-type ribon-helix-helix transcriptional regulator